MLFFMCCYCGVYPWGLLRPRSTKTAVTVLLQVHSVRRTSGAPMRLSILRCLPQNGPQSDLRRGQRSTRRLQEQPVFYLWGKFEGFWAWLALRDGYFTKQQIAKNSGASPLTTSQRLPGVAWIISRPARGENAIAEGAQRAPKALQ